MPINGKVQCIDHCIHRVVAALNAGGVRTIASCCGHGKMPEISYWRTIASLPSSHPARTLGCVTIWRAVGTAIRLRIDPLGGRHGWTAQGKIPKRCRAPSKAEPVTTSLMDLMIPVRLRIVVHIVASHYMFLSRSLLPLATCFPLPIRRDGSGGLTAENIVRATCCGVASSLGIGFAGRPRVRLRTRFSSSAMTSTRRITRQMTLCFGLQQTRWDGKSIQ